MVSLHNRELNLKRFTILSVIQNDEYFVLRDFGPYAERQEAVGRAYENRTKWLEMSILNIAQSGHFASDRTILQYSNEIGVSVMQLNSFKEVAILGDILSIYQQNGY